MIQKDYRPDIDGLRFIAVFPVILFHLDLNIFKGGFLGVDVFFVISGFLITNIIFKQIENNEFSIYKFYLRRARRILPALFVVLLLTICLSYIFYFPEELEHSAKTVLSVVFFVSNIFFWKTTNYFNDLTQQSPLLHTWSLAVEEQFYIFYPLIFVFFTKFLKKSNLIIAFVIVFFISLSLSSYAVQYHPNANFFLTPFRIFELLTGCIIALISYPKKNFYFSSTFINNIISFTSLIVLLLTFIFFNKFSLLPSYFSLATVLSTALLIFCLPHSDKKIKYLLSNKPIVFLGKISYSLYLFHLPFVVFFQIDKSFIDITIFLLLLIFLSYLSWKYIENPFRNKKIINNKFFLKILFFSVFIIICLSIFTLNFSKNKIFDNILVKSLNEEKKLIYQSIKKVRLEYKQLDEDPYINFNCKISTLKIDDKFLKKFENCKKSNSKFILILGDSHARDIYLSFLKVVDYDFVVGLLPAGCRPHSQILKCKDLYNEYKKFIIKEKNNSKILIYSQSGSKLLKHQYTLPIQTLKIKKTIDYLNKININQNLLWLGPNIEPGIKMNFAALNTIYKKKFTINEIRHLYKVDKKIEEMLKSKKINYLSKIDLMQYNANKDFFLNNSLTYRDQDHWSEFGQIYFGKKIFNSEGFLRFLNDQN